jgi:two-component system, response regulator RegA
VKNDKRMLLVEDDEANRITLAALFEDEGFEVDEAGDIDEAMRKIESGGSYGVFLLDLNLGDRCATELIAPIRSRHPAAFVALLTGAELAALPSGVDCVFRKGEGLEQLLRSLSMRES